MQISFRLSRVPAATPEEQIFEITLNIKKNVKEERQLSRKTAISFMFIFLCEQISIFGRIII